MSKLKTTWQRSFLYKLKQQNKLLFFIAVGWLAINLLTSVFGHQTTPFYQWAMYAPPVSEKNEYTVNDVVYGGDALGDSAAYNHTIMESHTWNDFHTLMFRYPTDNYLSLSDPTYRPPDYATIKKMAASIHVNITPFLTKISTHYSFDHVRKYNTWLSRYTSSTTDDDVYAVRIVENTLRYDSLGHVHLVEKKDHY